MLSARAPLLPAIDPRRSAQRNASRFGEVLLRQAEGHAFLAKQVADAAHSADLAAMLILALRRLTWKVRGRKPQADSTTQAQPAALAGNAASSTPARHRLSRTSATSHACRGRAP